MRRESESLALKLRSDSFLGVSFLLRVRFALGLGEGAGGGGGGGGGACSRGRNGNGQAELRDDVDLMEHDRDGGALDPDMEVAGVQGLDELLLTIDDRFDDIVDAFDGRMMGDNAEGYSALLLWEDFEERVVGRLINNGFGSRSFSI